LRDDSRCTGNWSIVRLIGTKSNREGIGARLTLSAGQLTLTREVRRGRSYASSSSPTCRFGLGGASKIDRLEVRWPSGKRQVFADLPANRYLWIREDVGIVSSP